MRDRQRELADEGDAVIEGRDIGTVVAPAAEVKVYLVARPDVRAQRRLSRAARDRSRRARHRPRLRDESDAARMQPADDARTIDTTDLDVDDVVAEIEALVRERSAA